MHYILGDLLSLEAGWLCFNVLRYFTLVEGVYSSLADFLLDTPVVLGQIVVPLCMVLLYMVAGSYNRTNTLYKSRLDELVTTLTVSLIGTVGIFFAVLIDDRIPERMANYELMMLLFMCLFVPVVAVRMVLITRNAKSMRRGEYVLRTLAVGADLRDAAMLRRIMNSRAHSGLSVLACVDSSGVSDIDSIEGVPVIKGDIRSIMQEMDIQALVLLPSYTSPRDAASLINELYSADIPIFVTPDLHSLITSRPRVSLVAGEPIIDVTKAAISPVATNLKRLTDIAVSSMFLLAAWPLLGVLALAVKLDSNGPVLYRQERVGYRKKKFHILKFRTMCVDAEAAGPALARENDPRITRVGSFMRKYRLDELPQFWNVLKGEMSLVGPRPEREYYLRQILDRHPASSLVHQVRPGITSWGMVKYGYASNIDQMLERLPYDLLYIENISFGVDLKILFHTVNTVLNGRGQ